MIKLLLFQLGLQLGGQFMLNHFVSGPAGLCWSLGFLAGVTFQGFCNRAARIRLRDDMLDILNKCKPKKKPKLTVVK
jgi:hypothetical protein